MRRRPLGDSDSISDSTVQGSSSLATSSVPDDYVSDDESSTTDDDTDDPKEALARAQGEQ